MRQGETRDLHTRGHSRHHQSKQHKCLGICQTRDTLPCITTQRTQRTPNCTCVKRQTCHKLTRLQYEARKRLGWSHARAPAPQHADSPPRTRGWAHPRGIYTRPKAHARAQPQIAPAPAHAELNNMMGKARNNKKYSREKRNRTKQGRRNRTQQGSARQQPKLTRG